MRTGTAAIAFAIGTLLCAPTLALAEGEALSRMEAMEERLMALEDRLAASEATVAAQRELLKGANVSGGVLGQAEGGRLLDRITFGGHIAASYLYNFHNPDGTNRFASQPFNQFNLNHNTFALDAAKLELGLPTNGPGTAGFQLDLLYGENNLILCGDERIGFSDPDDSLGLSSTPVAPFTGDEILARESGDTNLCVQQAYASYDMNGVVFDFGKWETLLGYEVLDSVENHHIQHGMLFTWAIPLTHTGLRVSGNLTEEVSWAAGVVNGFNNVLDQGDSKGALGQLAFNSGNLSTSVSAYFGSEEYRASSVPGGAISRNKDQVLVLDAVISMMLNDTTEFWVNGNWAELERDALTATPVSGPGGVPSPFGASIKSDPHWWGVAAGLAFDLNERVGLALRGEYFVDDNGARLPLQIDATAPEDEVQYWSATATLAYHLTERMMARAEFRYDWYDSDDNDDRSFPTDTASFEDQNAVGIVEVSYTFD